MGKCQTRLAHPALAEDGGDGGREIPMKSTMGSSSDDVHVGGEADEASPATPSALSIFHEDIILSILSYVADAPFETAENGEFLSESFLKAIPSCSLVCEHDFYWKHALLRLASREPTLWGEGLERVIFDAKCDELRAQIMERRQSRTMRRRGKRTKHQAQEEVSRPQSVEESKVPASSEQLTDSSTKPPPSKEEELLNRARTAIEYHPPHHHTATPSGIYQCLYQSVVVRHLQYQAPVFYMPSDMELGSPYGLHFFEPRYRLLVSEVMASFPVAARRGNPILPMVPGLFPPPTHCPVAMEDDVKSSTLHLLEENPSILKNHHLPTFIHAHQSRLSPNSPATIVQVQQCVVQPDGSADIFLLPLAYVWLKEIWERPGTGGLLEARGIRMGKEASENFEQRCSMARYGMGDGRGWRNMLPIP
ncbi:hypothetical protein ACHAWF_016607 [Thalassiosira exigua]